MPLGLNRGSKSVRNGFPITLPHTFGNVINTATHNFGNPVVLPVDFGNDVTLPVNFGNIISGAPTVVSLDVTAGTPSGGTAVTITGTNFIAGATVLFGTVPATSVVVVSSTSITVVTPAGSASSVVDVTVTNVDFQSGTLPNAYTYGVALSVPAFSINNNGDTVTITPDVNATSTWYTVDGTTPTFPASGTTAQYTAPFTITGPETVKALSHGTGAYLDSSVGTHSFLQLTTPTFSLSGTDSQVITVTPDGRATSTYYTTDGSTPTTGSTLYTAPFAITTAETVKAISYDPGLVDSAVGAQAFTQQATPTIAIANATDSQTITLTSSGATHIYYTTDGSTPTTGSTLYGSPFAISSAETVKALAVQTGLVNSAVGSQAYTVQATPTFSPVAGSYTGTQSVTITSASATNIYYTTDGSTPTVASGTLYSGAISVAASETVKALAIQTGLVNSAIGSAAYTIVLAPALIAHAVVQQASSFAQAGATSAINTTGANFIAIATAVYDNPVAANAYPLVWDAVGSAPVAATQCTGTASVSGTSMTLTSTFPAGAGSNGWVGQTIAVQGFNFTTNPNACGYFVCTASSTSSITVTTASAATNGASATNTYVAPSNNIWTHQPNADLPNHINSAMVWYCNSPTVGSGHQFQFTAAMCGGDGGSIGVAAFSNVKTSSSYLQKVNSSQVASPTLTVQAGSTTPTAANNLLLSWATGANPTGPFSVDSGFTNIDVYSTASARYSTISWAYLIPSSTSAVNPKWTVGTNATNISSCNLEFAHA